MQIVATTHSPYLLDAFDPADVRVMTIGAEGGSRCRSLVDHPEFEKWKQALSAGELWATLGEEWIRGDSESAA